MWFPDPWADYDLFGVVAGADVDYDGSGVIFYRCDRRLDGSEGGVRAAVDVVQVTAKACPLSATSTTKARQESVKLRVMCI